MFIRCFLYSNTEKDAIVLLEKILSGMETSILNKQIVEAKPYWKIEGIYVIGVELDVDADYISSNDFEEYLKKISDNWISFGEPVEELLASETGESTTYMMDGLKMIDIYLEK